MNSAAPQKVIEQMAPSLGEEEKQAVSDYLASGGWLTEFEKTTEFERRIAEFTGAKHAIVVSSGTAALFCMVSACGLGPGDEVLIPDLTMVATANAVQLAGARPVFVDIDPETLCIDLQAAERAITPHTRAMILVSLNGRSPDMDAAGDLCDRRRLIFLEDAAQSLGSRYRGRHLGTCGTAGILSFSPLKIITTGQGGAVLTDDDEIAQRVRRFKDFGREKGGIDVHTSMGYNFKFTDVQAVIGIEQIRKLSVRLARKKEIFRRYREELEAVVEFLPTDLNEVAPWFIDVYLDDRDQLATALRDCGIKTRAVYPPVHAQPAYAMPGSFPASESASTRGLWLPSSVTLADDEIHQISSQVRSFLRSK